MQLYDQVWSVLHRPAAATLQKKKQLAATGQAVRRLQHRIERVLDLPHSEPLSQEPQICKTEVKGGCAANVAVDCWRVPRTFCSLSWIDGNAGSHHRKPTVGGQPGSQCCGFSMFHFSTGAVLKSGYHNGTNHFHEKQ